MSIALPLMMGLALEQLIGMTDVLFLGRYGEAELAAAGVAGIYVMLVMMLGLGYTVGSQSLMSRANGAGRAEEVGAIFRQSAIFMTACGFVIMLASWFLIDPMFERFIAADAVCLCRTAGASVLRCRDAHPGDYVGIYCDGARQLRLKFAAYLWAGSFPRTWHRRRSDRLCSQ